LVLVFGLIMVLLEGLGAGFVLARYDAGLHQQLNQNLQQRLADVRTTLAKLPGPTNSSDLPIIPRVESFAQVLTPAGVIVAGAPEALQDRPILSSRQLAVAASRVISAEQAAAPRANRARLLAGPGAIGNQPVVIVVGASLDGIEKSEERLRLNLAIALPVLTALVIGAGWVLMGAVLRPIREMVGEAESFSTQLSGRRLSTQGVRELSELGHRLNEMLARIETSVRHERMFLDDASHELRTPIAIARGELELVRPLVTDGVLAGALDSALEELDRLQRLATSLLVLARSRISVRPVSFDLGTVAEDAAQSLARGSGLDGIVVSCHGHARVLGDPEAIERAVVNLIDNAARHARTCVEVVVEPVSGEVVMEVRDDGPGFGSEVLERVGERFVAGSGGGTGLGLAIARVIVTNAEGSVELRDGAEGGGVVILRFPEAEPLV
jgi:signal transduction histidine kinase